LNEQADFDFEYPVVPVSRPGEIDVFLKHAKVRIRTDESWMEVSERMVRHFGFPKGTIFPIFPVDNVISRMGDDDHAYACDWKENGQYWFDIIRDPIEGPRGWCKEIRLIDPSGRVDMFVIPTTAIENDVATLWKKILGFPEDRQMAMTRRNDTGFYWGTLDRPDHRIMCMLKSRSNSATASLYAASNIFMADRLCRVLGVKVPPFELCQVTQANRRITVEQDDDWYQLSWNILRGHALA
jgi:hypothetical protein